MKRDNSITVKAENTYMKVTTRSRLKITSVPITEK